MCAGCGLFFSDGLIVDQGVIVHEHLFHQWSAARWDRARREAAFQPLWDAESGDGQPLDVEAFVRTINGEPEPMPAQQLAAFVRAINGEPEPVDPRSLAAFVAAITGRPDPNQQREFEEFVGLVTGVSEGDWDAGKHPRQGGPPNAGWFAAKDGGGGAGTGATACQITPSAALKGKLARRTIRRTCSKWPMPGG